MAVVVTCSSMVVAVMVKEVVGTYSNMGVVVTSLVVEGSCSSGYDGACYGCWTCICDCSFPHSKFVD